MDLEFNGNGDEYKEADSHLAPSLFLGQRLFARGFLRYCWPALATPAYLNPSSRPRAEQAGLLAWHALIIETGGGLYLPTVFLLIHARMLAGVL